MGRRDGLGACPPEWLVDAEWESLLALPITEVRTRLGIDAPPAYRPVRSAELRAQAA